MKNILKLVAIVVFSLPATAWPATGYNFRLVNANAYFSSADSSGCITDVGVYVTEGGILALTGSPPAPREGVSYMQIFVSNSGTCTGTPLFAYGVMGLARPEFVVSGNLDSATLNATVSLFDIFSNIYLFDVSMNLAWIGTGPLEGGNSGGIWRSGNCHTVSHFRGRGGATEASGSVSDGTTNYTPLPALFSDINVSIAGEITSGCN